MSVKDQPKRILIAEDDPSIAHLLTVQLEMEGYQVIHAPDGEEAWGVLQEFDLPDLIILDVLMPRMDGYQVCRRIRADSRTSTLPVVFLTALQDSANRLEGLDAGANDFLGKPWSKAELYARIRTLLKLKDAQDALGKQHRQLSLLYDISRELSAFLALDEMLAMMLARSAHVVDSPQGSLILLSNGDIRHKVSLNENGEPEIALRPVMTEMEQMTANWLLKTRRPLLIEDTSQSIEFENGNGIRCMVAVPLMLKQHMQGFLLLLHHTPYQFAQEHLDLLDSISRQTIITIENIRLYERTQEERQRFATLIASMDDAVIATDKDLIMLVNPAGEHLLGLSQVELFGRSVRQVLQDQSLLGLFAQVAADNRAHTMELTWGNGKTFYATVSPVGGGGQVAVIQDITALKELQSIQLEAEQEKATRIRDAFNRYMSPELVNRALSEERGLMEKRERREAAVLFADMRGFTRLTLRFSPDQVVAILNEFFTVMTNIAYSHNGTIFDIAGDELMVGFGVPFDLEDPIVAALHAAVGMQEMLDSLASKWWQTYGDRRLGMGIGIDFGEVIVGNVGSPTRMNYALVGLPVTTAHALVSTAGDGEIRFSQVVMSRFHSENLNYPISAVNDVWLKGREQPETIYTMVVERTRDSDVGKAADGI